MEERDVEPDHSTLNCWVLRYAPLLKHERTTSTFDRSYDPLCAMHQANQCGLVAKQLLP